MPRAVQCVVGGKVVGIDDAIRDRDAHALGRKLIRIGDVPNVKSVCAPTPPVVKLLDISNTLNETQIAR